MRICIDPGHGGSQFGAAYDHPQIEFDGVMEKEFNLAVGLFTELMLSSIGHHVGMTRTEDIDVTLKDRVRMAEMYNSELFVSIHADAHESNASGYTVYDIGDEGFGDCVHSSLQTYFPGNRDRGAKSHDYSVLRGTTHIPSCLVECEFVSNLEQRVNLRDPATQYKYALAITNGISLFINEQG